MSGVAHDYGGRGYVEGHVGAGCNQRIIADGDVPYDDGVSSDPDPIPDSGRAFSRPPIRLTNGDARHDVYVRPEYSSRIDDDSAKVPQIQTWADDRRIADIESVFDAVMAQKSAYDDIGNFCTLLLPQILTNPQQHRELRAGDGPRHASE